MLVVGLLLACGTAERTLDLSALDVPDVPAASSAPASTWSACTGSGEPAWAVVEVRAGEARLGGGAFSAIDVAGLSEAVSRLRAEDPEAGCAVPGPKPSRVLVAVDAATPDGDLLSVLSALALAEIGRFDLLAEAASPNLPELEAFALPHAMQRVEVAAEEVRWLDAAGNVHTATRGADLARQVGGLATERTGVEAVLLLVETSAGDRIAAASALGARGIPVAHGGPATGTAPAATGAAPSAAAPPVATARSFRSGDPVSFVSVVPPRVSSSRPQERVAPVLGGP